MTPAEAKAARDHSVFEADLSGAVLNMRLLARLLGWLAPYALRLWLSVALVLLASIAAVLLEIVIARVLVDYIISGKAASLMPDLGMIAAVVWLEQALGISSLPAAGGVFLMLMLISALAGHWHRLTLTDAIVRGLRDLRQGLFSHLETRPAAFFDRVPVGRIMTRVTNDVEALFEMLRGLGGLIGEFVPFFVALGVMFATSVELTLVLLCLVPVVAVVTHFFRGATREVFRQVRSSVSALNHNLQESLAGMQVVQLSGREARNFAAYTRLNKRNRRYEYQSINLGTVYGAFNDSLTAMGLGIIIYYGAGEALSAEMTLGGVILFTRFMGMLFTPVVSLGEQLNVLFRAMASGERIFQALDWDERIHEPRQPLALPPRLQGRIEFRRLRFGYSEGTPVLKGVSLAIEPGEKLAIVGPTGSGKSTLVRLLGRFYDLPNGMIFVDGLDVNRIASSDLRRRIGIVLQDFHVFSGSIHDNIALGNPAITPARAQQAARTVNADAFIERLPQGYATPLLERGANLSQGQRQLLAFARVLAADPEILVLDEATASIDTETELLIQDGLRHLLQGRTAILIAHRLQTVQQADRILVLHEGQAKEYGTHAELLAAGGLYRTLHSLQFQGLDGGGA